MPRYSSQKLKLAYLRQIFLDQTSPDNPITVKELINALSANGISAERKSIYDDIEALRLLGMDIQAVKSKSTGYYLATRDFELSELKLLIDAVASSKFISEKQSANLIEKLARLACRQDRPSLNRRVFVSNRSRNTDGDILKTVDVIHEGIEKDLTVRFKYFSWTSKKQKEYRREGKFYHISPWSLVWDDSCYYLVGFDNDLGEIRHFRVDKMELAAVCSMPRMGKAQFKSFDINAYSDAVFGMFGGLPQRVTLLCKNRLANIMLDRFGKATPLISQGESFKITVNVVPSPVFFGWVLGFGGEVKIISPQEVCDSLKSIISTADF